LAGDAGTPMAGARGGQSWLFDPHAAKGTPRHLVSQISGL
jgi:hypothetical protein